MSEMLEPNLQHLLSSFCFLQTPLVIWLDCSNSVLGKTDIGLKFYITILQCYTQLQSAITKNLSVLFKKKKEAHHLYAISNFLITSSAVADPSQLLSSMNISKER